jgi:glycosyltransferase involved in cell wall biosynthesis
VRNIGLDNSGTHTRLDRRFFHASIDSNWQPIKYCKADPVDIGIAENFRKIFNAEKLSVYARIKIKVLRALKLFQLRLRDILDDLMRPSTVIVQKTDILMINTIQLQGGAARAAFRCFNGMRNLYPNAGYLSLFGELSQNQLYFIDKTSLVGKLASRFSVLDRLQLPLYPNRKSVIFSPGFWANPSRICANSFSPKLIHLHWVSYGILNVNEISDFKMPIVWTLHDEWAFTGGCHYTDSCKRFENQCGCCPSLGSDDPYDISNQLWLQKMDAYTKAHIVVVAPSRWMADEAKKSSLFANKRIEVIPNGLDVDIFCPINQDEAKKFFNIQSTSPILLFGANLVSDVRKGGDLLLEALNMIDFRCTLLVFGEGDIGLISNTNIELHRVGNIEDDDQLAMMYSLADVFVCPSRIDNLPNTVAEAMACGVPCVAFDIGGLPDMIDHMENGWLASPFEVADLLKGIKWVLGHKQPFSLRQSARSKALSEYSLSVMSSRYESLYEELLSLEAE